MSNHEPVLLVSRHNHPRGSCQRGRMQRDRLIHRASYVVVQDLAGRVCVQQRAADKHFYPGGWDLAAGGVMRPDESVAQGLSRELHEELGLRRQFRRWQWFWFANPFERISQDSFHKRQDAKGYLAISLNPIVQVCTKFWMENSIAHYYFSPTSRRKSSMD